MGDHVVIVNAEKIRLTGDKMDTKLYPPSYGLSGRAKDSTPSMSSAKIRRDCSSRRLHVAENSTRQPHGQEASGLCGRHPSTSGAELGSDHAELIDEDSASYLGCISVSCSLYMEARKSAWQQQPNTQLDGGNVQSPGPGSPAWRVTLPSTTCRWKRPSAPHAAADYSTPAGDGRRVRQVFYQSDRARRRTDGTGRCIAPCHRPEPWSV